MEATARTAARRGTRLAAGEAPRIDGAGWAERLGAAHPGLFECEVSCGPGWPNLLHAMATWLAGMSPPARLAFTQVKEKYGGLRAYHVGADMRAEGIVDAFEVSADAVYETCGSPAVLRRTPGGYYHAACGMHAGGDPVGDGGEDGLG